MLEHLGTPGYKNKKLPSPNFFTVSRAQHSNLNLKLKSGRKTTIEFVVVFSGLSNFLSYIILSKLCIKFGKIQAKICCQEFARSLRSARIRQNILLEGGQLLLFLNRTL